MNIGQLKNRLTLQYQVKVKNAMGGTTISYKNEATVWAAIWSTLGSEAVRSGQLTLEITHRIRIRYRDDIKGSWRILHGEKYYSIVSIIDPNMDHKLLDLLCKETETE